MTTPVPQQPRLPQLWRDLNVRDEPHDQYHDFLNRALSDWYLEYAKAIRELQASVNGRLLAVASGSTITQQTLQDIAGMTLALTAGTWWFMIEIHGSKATLTAGAQFGVGYSGTMTSMDANQSGQLAGTTWSATARITAKSTASTVCMTTSGAEERVNISGQIIVSTSGNLTAQGLAVTSNTLTVRAGSWMQAIKVA